MGHSQGIKKEIMARLAGFCQLRGSWLNPLETDEKSRRWHELTSKLSALQVPTLCVPLSEGGRGRRVLGGWLRLTIPPEAAL